MFLRLALVIAILACSSISCVDSGAPVAPPPAAKEIPQLLVPLKIGNSWTYRVTTYDTTGAIAWIDTLRRTTRADTVVEGLTWFLLGYDNPSFGEWGQRNDSMGFHETNWEYVDYTYRYPAHLGDRIGSWTVISLDTLVTTPLGDLHCHKYQTIWYGFPLNTLIAPGVGIVRIEDTAAGYNFLIQVSDLISAEISH